MESKKTLLYEAHRELGAQIIEFAGYSMPIWYRGIKEEVLATRKAAGLFDISHMAKISISCNESLNLLQKLVTRDISKMAINQVVYTFLCNKKGGIIDDLLVYRLGKDYYLLIVNAVNFEKDLNWLKEHSRGKKITILCNKNYIFLALQGPKSKEILRKIGLLETDLNLSYYHCDFTMILKELAIISRTGYTGEDGFEILVLRPENPEKIWREILEAGRAFDLQPCGLGARDILRLEAGLPLYNQEISEEITPLEAGLEKFVSFEKKFIGREALLKQKRVGVRKKLVGFEVLSGRIAHPGYLILVGEEVIGRVVSGNISWTLEKSIGTGFVNTEFAIPGILIEIEIRGQRHQAKIVELPFYKRG